MHNNIYYFLFNSVQVEFRNAAANSTTSNTEILVSGCLVLIRGNQGFFAMCPDGVMDEVVNTGGSWAIDTTYTIHVTIFPSPLLYA